MRQTVEDRAVELGTYIVHHGATVRQTAARFGISKSTVHKDITVRLRRKAPSLYRQARAVLDANKEQRHLRGGAATREKYARLRTEKPG